MYLRVRSAILLIPVILAACVTVPPEAARVQLHSQMSSLLQDCRRLGPVRGSGSRIISKENALEKAKVQMRKQAATKYGADSVALINIDPYWNEIVANGVAFDCYQNR